MEMEIVALLDLRSFAVNSENSGQLENSLACILVLVVSLYLVLLVYKSVDGMVFCLRF